MMGARTKDARGVPGESAKGKQRHGRSIALKRGRCRLERKNVRKCLSLRLDVPGAIVVIPSRQSRNPSL